MNGLQPKNPHAVIMTAKQLTMRMRLFKNQRESAYECTIKNAERENETEDSCILLLRRVW